MNTVRLMVMHVTGVSAVTSAARGSSNMSARSPKYMSSDSVRSVASSPALAAAAPKFDTRHSPSLIM